MDGGATYRDDAATSVSRGVGCDIIAYDDLGASREERRWNIVELVDIVFGQFAQDCVNCEAVVADVFARHLATKTSNKITICLNPV